ncbi:MAG: hypothetical protein P8X42_01660 [Calditrichaceae bacterium]
MSATFWDSFDHLLKQAEEEFFNYNFKKAIETWKNYYKITAKKEYQHIADEVEATWSEDILSDITTLARLFILFKNFKTKYDKKEISHYTFQLYKKLLIKLYKENFQETAKKEISTESGIFEYLSGNYSTAVELLNAVITGEPESIFARIYLGFAYLSLKDQRSMIALLSQNLVLGADKLNNDDLYLSQIKMLYGKLFSALGNSEEAAWLLVFESWFRNWLMFEEDKLFFDLIRKKETNERIVQVKYYSYERYRHFVRCLYISEYTRQFMKKEHGLISEQEHYMEKLDGSLFDRYRKKRKALKQPASKVKTA